MSELNKPMRSALAYVRQHGGAILRDASGVWLKPGAGAFRPGMPHVVARHVYALARLGYLEVRWHGADGRDGRATLTQLGIDATNQPGEGGFEQPSPEPSTPKVAADPVVAALTLLHEVRRALHAAHDTPGGPITDTIWLVDQPCTAFDALDDAIERLEAPCAKKLCDACAQILTESTPELSAQT